MDKQYNYLMLEIARNARCLTQKEVVSRVSFSQPKLSKAEKNQKQLTTPEIEELANVYNYPLSFFYKSVGVSMNGHLYFRRRVTTSAKVVDSIIANTQVLKIAIDELAKSVELPHCPLQDYKVTDSVTPEDIAQKTRYALKVFRGPVPNLINLLEANGVIVMKIDFGDDVDKFDGLSTITNSGHKVIFLNSRMPTDRMRFSLAHELGHLIMHLVSPPQDAETVEQEADRFASEFLMPKDEIISSLSYLNINKLGDLKRFWHVSMRAILRKAKDLERLSVDSYRNFQINFSKKGYNKREPIILPIENPSIVTDMVNIHKEDLGYSDDDIMEFLSICSIDYSKWFAQPKIITLNSALKV